MIILRGDMVRTKGGDTGEVIETWGTYEAYVRIKLADSGKRVPMFAKDVEEVLYRPTGKRKWA